MSHKKKNCVRTDKVITIPSQVSDNISIQIPSREMDARERALLCVMQGSLPEGTVCNAVSYKFSDKKYLYIDIIVLKF